MELEDLKFELFDTIAKVKNSMDIVAIKEETDTIFERYKAKNTEEDYFDIPSFFSFQPLGTFLLYYFIYFNTSFVESSTVLQFVTSTTIVLSYFL